MEPEFEAWSHAGAHRRKLCVDCHLPNDNLALHYAWKSIDGIKDVLVFYSGTVSEPIKLSSHGVEVVQANCIRCHRSTVEFINPERRCWECHRRLMHRRSGAIATV
jgi:cytochrome c nitrite reductase small subunit